MKILFVVSGNHGAPSPVVQNQAEALMSEGVEVEWYLIKGKGILGYLKNVTPLRQYLREHHYDAIHAHYSLSAFAASLAGAKPLVVSLMGSDVKAAGWYKFVIRLMAFLFRWKAIIVKSADMYRDLGIRRALVIPNGVNLDRFHPMDKTECQKRLGWNKLSSEGVSELGSEGTKVSKKIHVLFPANASRPEKDYALAEAVVTLINQRIGDLSFVISDLSENDKVQPVSNKQQATNNKLQNSHLSLVLHSFENTPNAETPYWYNAADVVLMTSKWEGSPNAIKEAMACSRPIVSTAVGDVSERLDGIEGCFVVPSRNPKAIASALSRALLVSATDGLARIQSEGLDIHTINQKIISLY